MSNIPPHIAMVAGEVSGDNLGEGLIRSLHERDSELAFWGVGNDQMIQAGLDTAFPMDDIAVMGIIEPLKILPQLIRRKNQLVKTILQNQPQAFVGIDAPDFNLRIARDVKSNRPNIPIIHYVSPSVWAWRQHRIFGIKATVDLMITLFPFESAFYDRYDVPNLCVGHPMAEQLPTDFSREEQRASLQITPAKTLIALLPGSRESEVERHLAIYCQAAEQIYHQHEHRDTLQFIIPAAKPSLKSAISAITDQHPNLPIRITDGQSSRVLQAADAALVTSGTATMEAMLCQCPMVVGYRTSKMTYQIAKRLVKTDYIAIPNLLATQPLVKEYIQTACTPENLATSIAAALQPDTAAALRKTFVNLHQSLQLGGSDAAADAILERIAQTASA